MLNKREHAEFCDSYVAFSGSIWVSWGDKTDFFILDGESACLRKRRSAVLLLRNKFIRPKNCWKRRSERSRSDSGATLDQTGEASRCSYAFSAMRMPHPYLLRPCRASTYHPANHIARLMPGEFRRDTEDSFQTKPKQVDIRRNLSRKRI
jgi:hypothetical protein